MEGKAQVYQEILRSLRKHSNTSVKILLQVLHSKLYVSYMSYSAISKTDFKYQKYYAEELFQKENIFFCVQNILSFAHKLSSLKKKMTLRPI